MLRFFSAIRRSLLDKNDTVKYLRYAVGEILLVIVGILIALQINNWNEHRKEQDLLSFRLVELHNDLNRDLDALISGVEPRLALKEQAIESFYTYMTDGETPSQDIFIEYYDYIMTWFSVTISYGTYNNIKQNGIDKLENEALRKQLVAVYERNLPRLVSFIHFDDQAIRSRVELLEDDFLGIGPVFGEFEERGVRLNKFPITENYFTHPSFYQILSLKTTDVHRKRVRLRSMKERYIQVIATLEQEMSDRSISFVPIEASSFEPNPEITDMIRQMRKD